MVHGVGQRHYGVTSHVRDVPHATLSSVYPSLMATELADLHRISLIQAAGPESR
jgi:hypothetical protein